MFKTLRFSLLSMLVMLCGTVMADEVSFAAGENATTCTVNGKDGIKVGTSKKGGGITITVPANTTKLTLHAAAWKGVTGLSVGITGATANPANIELTADDGISNNSPFTLSGNEDDFKFEIALSEITTETELTLSADKRFVVWDASAEVSGGGETPVVTVAKPVITPNGGTFFEAQDVTISCETEGATIYYTTDGTNPSEASTRYTPFRVNETTTVKAIAVKDNIHNLPDFQLFNHCRADSPGKQHNLYFHWRGPDYCQANSQVRIYQRQLWQHVDL